MTIVSFYLKGVSQQQRSRKSWVRIPAAGSSSLLDREEHTSCLILDWNGCMTTGKCVDVLLPLIENANDNDDIDNNDNDAIDDDDDDVDNDIDNNDDDEKYNWSNRWVVIPNTLSKASPLHSQLNTEVKQHWSLEVLMWETPWVNNYVYRQGDSVTSAFPHGGHSWKYEEIEFSFQMIVLIA